MLYEVSDPQQRCLSSVEFTWRAYSGERDFVGKLSLSFKEEETQEEL